MAIYQYTDEKGKKRYWLKGYIGIDPLTGKEKRVNRKGFTSKKQAELELARLQLGLTSDTVKKPKFKDLYDQWIVTYKTSVKPSSFTATEDIFRLHILPTFGDIYIDKISPDLIQSWVNKKYKSGLVKYREYHTYLNTIMKLAHSKRYIDYNPCTSTIFPKSKKVDKEDIVIWDKEELQRFLSICRETKPLEWYTFFRLIAYTGMRRGEMLALEWPDISFSNKTVNINKSRKVAPNPNYIDGGSEARKIEITGSTKTENKRIISLDKETLQVLHKWKKYQLRFFGPQKIIFTNTTGGYLKLNYPIKILNDITKKYNLRKIDIHRFRHIHTTMLIISNQNKNSLATIMHRLGHADISTTLNIYNHIVKEEKENILDNFVEFIES